MILGIILLALGAFIVTQSTGDNRIGWPMIVIGIVLIIQPAFGRDDGRYANSPLKGWFDGLRSGNGLCCSYADGRVLDDPDWDSSNEHYRVRVDGEWVDVPDQAVITEPNRAGRTMVWPYKNINGDTMIRCFMPGVMG